ncbi:MAG: DNA strand exchange inhibitor protein [Candidatus Brocadiaceae bacterium]|nr:DNA strand exchange inhibitor protein [Candidatus Brocadiaceae bacterium]
MHEHAIKVLEFGKVVDILSAYAVSPRGKLLARSLRPMDEPAGIERALQETTEMVRALGREFTLPLGPVEDVSAAARRASGAGSPLEPSTFWRIAEALDTAHRVGNALRRLGGSYPALLALGDGLPRLPEMVARIRSTVDATGLVLDGASPALKAVRSRIRSIRGRIERRLLRLVNDPRIRPHLQYGNPTIHRERYVLPVNAYRKAEVRGLVHGSSDSGATLYVEPMEIVPLGNELGEALGEEEEEIRRVLWALTREVAAEAETIVEAVQRLAEVDLVRAKALMSAAFRMAEPQMAGAGALELVQARHPVLLHLTRPRDRTVPREADLDFEAVVPLDVRLGRDFRMIVITGPNTGGKTVVLKTVGLICLMARAGMHVPAQRAVVPLYDTVCADIGDEQSLEQSLSTFSSHVSRIIRILRTATRGSLVLLDELGAGTDPAEGSALGAAILKRLADLACSAIVVTHLGPLKSFAAGRPGVENASVDFDPRTLRPTYHLTIGTIGSSNALEIARRLGLPDEVLSAARELLNAQSAGEYGTILEEVRLVRQDAEERRERVLYLEQQAARLKADYEETLRRLRAQEDRQSADFGLRMQETLRELHEEADRLAEDLRHSHKAVSRRVRTVRDGLRGCLDDLAELLRGHRIERPLQAGDDVYVIRLHRWGTVERVHTRSGSARVRVGDAQVEVPVEDLQPWGRHADQP